MELLLEWSLVCFDVMEMGSEFQSVTVLGKN